MVPPPGNVSRGRYTGEILKDQKPPTFRSCWASKFELIINLQIAKAIGLEVPPTLLARADEMIE